MSLNLISKYLFLEQKAQSLEEVLTFLTKAGGSIHIFSESTHIEALIKPCKMMKIKKKSYLYNPNAQGLKCAPSILQTRQCNDGLLLHTGATFGIYRCKEIQ